jgi:hypothetical protein
MRAVAGNAGNGAPSTTTLLMHDDMTKALTGAPINIIGTKPDTVDLLDSVWENRRSPASTGIFHRAYPVDGQLKYYSGGIGGQWQGIAIPSWLDKWVIKARHWMSSRNATQRAACLVWEDTVTNSYVYCYVDWSYTTNYTKVIEVLNGVVIKTTQITQTRTIGWHDVQFTCDGSDIKIYYDGALQLTHTLQNSPSVYQAAGDRIQFYIGYENATRYMITEYRQLYYSTDGAYIP